MPGSVASGTHGIFCCSQIFHTLITLTTSVMSLWLQIWRLQNGKRTMAAAPLEARGRRPWSSGRWPIQ